MATHQFFIYCNIATAKDDTHIHWRPFSRDGFLKDLKSCNGVISNAGFELLSEALYLGKKLLIKPLAGQMEQASNAHVISELKLGTVMNKLDQQAVDQFLNKPSFSPIRYPDVARLVAEWIESGNWEDVNGLAHSAWANIKFS
jgi:uncharacterized protein (TIGR00661 family)